jgi:hypothetical protein
VKAADIPGDGAGTVVTITIGGNDLRTGRDENWPDALSALHHLGALPRVAQSNQMANLDDIREDLTATYRAIGEQYPDITVRVLGYPRLMQGNGRCDGVTGHQRRRGRLDRRAGRPAQPPDRDRHGARPGMDRRRHPVRRRHRRVRQPRRLPVLAA